jgi:uncharacterized membrane protein
MQAVSVYWHDIALDRYDIVAQTNARGDRLRAFIPRHERTTMKTPASIGGHPLHPMLIALPVGLWIFSLVADLIGVATGNNVWNLVAFYTMAGGIVGGLLAAIPGVIDFLSLRQEKVRRIALWHMAINVAVLTIFAINLALRVNDMASPPMFAIGLSVIAIALLMVSGWLGAEMVHVHGVGVVDARVDSPDARRSPTQSGSTEAAQRR